MKNRFPGISRAVLSVNALAHKGRLLILDTMHSTGIVNTCELGKFLRVEESEMSRHLGVLATSGAIGKDTNGKYSPYKINYKRLAKIAKAVKTFSGK